MSAEEPCYPHARSILEARTGHLHKEEGGEPVVRYFISSLSVEDTSPGRFAQLAGQSLLV